MRTSTLVATLAAVAVLPLSGAAQATECTPARTMIVLDKSSSMVTGTINGTPKWDIAVNALTGLGAAYESSIELGLMLFPDPSQCAPGKLHVQPALGSAGAIGAALQSPPPDAGNWTPMAQTLDAALAEPSLMDATKPRYVVLVTDGWQWCSPYDPATRFDGVDSVAALKTAGITTFVVGFGDAVDALALNKMAVAAGTALPGCDPQGDSPSSPNPCYFQADDPPALDAALDTIAVQVSAEVCDGEDNDCDGEIDEDLERACSTACGDGTETCVAGVWGNCSATAPAAEICDGADNDCDGTTDPDCPCTAGETRPCGVADACQQGTQTCDETGTWGDCVGAVDPLPEACDGIDNDCDGAADETDDPTMPLCPEGQSCQSGGCVDNDEPAPPAEDGAEAVIGEDGSCACRAAGSERSSAGGILAALGLAACVARRRRSRRG